MLFLMRNVAAVAVPPLQELAVKMFFDMVSRWKEINKRRSRDVELEVLLHSMEVSLLDRIALLEFFGVFFHFSKCDGLTAYLPFRDYTRLHS